MIIRELAAKLGLEISTGDFIKADFLMTNIHKALEKAKEKVIEFAIEMKNFIPELAEEAKALETTAAKTGLTTDAIQRLGYVAERSESSQEALIFSVGRLGMSMQKVKEGSADMSETFRKLGVKVLDSSGKLRSTDEVLFDLADKFKAMPAGLEKANQAVELFGRQGRSMIPMLNEGREGIEKLSKQADDFGLVMNEHSVKAGAAFTEAMEDMHFAAKGVTRSFGADLMPAVTEVFEAFAKWRVENAAVTKQRMHQLAVVLSKAVKVLGRAFLLFLDTLKALGVALDFIRKHWVFFAAIALPLLVAGLASATSALLAHVAAAALTASWYFAVGVAMIRTAVTSAAAWTAANAPLIVMGLALVFAALAAEDLYVALEGGDSIAGRYGKRFLGIIDTLSTPMPEDSWPMWIWRLAQNLNPFVALHKLLGNIATVVIGIEDIWSRMTGGTVEEGRTALASMGRGRNNGTMAPTDAAWGGYQPSFAGAWGGTTVAASEFSRSNSVMAPVTFNIVQQPGQDSRELAEHIDERIQAHQERTHQEAAEAE